MRYARRKRKRSRLRSKRKKIEQLILSKKLRKKRTDRTKKTKSGGREKKRMRWKMVILVICLVICRL